MRRLIVGAVLAACSCGGAGGQAKPLCVGQAGVALAYQVIASASRVEGGAQVLFDNGSWFLFVDGDCRYWTLPAEAPGEWADVRTGTLNSTEAAELAADLAVEKYARLAGIHQDEREPIADAPTIRFHDGVHRVECGSGCSGDVPNVLATAATAGLDWVELLWQRGKPVQGPVRVIVVRLGEGPRLLGPPAPWPAGDVAAVAITEEEAVRLEFGEGVLFEGTKADSLRKLRAEYRDGLHGNWYYRYIPIDDPTGESAGYRAYVRDTLPFEDDRGIVVPPMLP